MAMGDKVKQHSVGKEAGEEGDRPLSKATRNLLDELDEVDSAEGRERFRQQLWVHLFGNLDRAVDEIYLLCELEGDAAHISETLDLLGKAGADFLELEERVASQDRLERERRAAEGGTTASTRLCPDGTDTGGATGEGAHGQTGGSELRPTKEEWKQHQGVAWEVRRAAGSPLRAKSLASSLEALRARHLAVAGRKRHSRDSEPDQNMHTGSKDAVQVPAADASCGEAAGQQEVAEAGVEQAHVGEELAGVTGSRCQDLKQPAGDAASLQKGTNPMPAFKRGANGSSSATAVRALFHEAGPSGGMEGREAQTGSSTGANACKDEQSLGLRAAGEGAVGKPGASRGKIKKANPEVKGAGDTTAPMEKASGVSGAGANSVSTQEAKEEASGAQDVEGGGGVEATENHKVQRGAGGPKQGERAAPGKSNQPMRECQVSPAAPVRGMQEADGSTGEVMVGSVMVRLGIASGEQRPRGRDELGGDGTQGDSEGTAGSGRGMSKVGSKVTQLAALEGGKVSEGEGGLGFSGTDRAEGSALERADLAEADLLRQGDAGAARESSDISSRGIGGQAGDSQVAVRRDSMESHISDRAMDAETSRRDSCPLWTTAGGCKSREGPTRAGSASTQTDGKRGGTGEAKEDRGGGECIQRERLGGGVGDGEIGSRCGEGLESSMEGGHGGRSIRPEQGAARGARVEEKGARDCGVQEGENREVGQQAPAAVEARGTSLPEVVVSGRGGHKAALRNKSLAQEGGGDGPSSGDEMTHVTEVGGHSETKLVGDERGKVGGYKGGSSKSEAWRERRNWVDILTSPQKGGGAGGAGGEGRRRSPLVSRRQRSAERAQRLHEKFMSPDRRKKTPLEMKKEVDEKLARALKARLELSNERRQRLQRSAERQSRVSEWQAVKRRRLREGMQRRQQGGGARHEAHLAGIVRRAGEESSKVNEVRFITSLTDENKKLSLQQRLQDSEARRLERLQTLRQKQKEDGAREEAAQERRRQLEADRQLKIAEAQRKKEEAMARREEEKRAMAAAREVRAVEAVRKKEERERAQQEETAQMAQRLRERLRHSATRRQLYLDLIRERAAQPEVADRRAVRFGSPDSPSSGGRLGGNRSHSSSPAGRRSATWEGRLRSRGRSLEGTREGVSGRSSPGAEAQQQEADQAVSLAAQKRRVKKIRQRLTARKFEFVEPGLAEGGSTGSGPAVGAGSGRTVGIARSKIAKWQQELQRQLEARGVGGPAMTEGTVGELIKFLDGKEVELTVARQLGLVDYLATAVPASHTSRPQASRITAALLRLLRVALALPANRTYAVVRNLLPPLVPMLAAALGNFSSASSTGGPSLATGLAASSLTPGTGSSGSTLRGGGAATLPSDGIAAASQGGGQGGGPGVAGAEGGAGGGGGGGGAGPTKPPASSVALPAGTNQGSSEGSFRPAEALTAVTPDGTKGETRGLGHSKLKSASSEQTLAENGAIEKRMSDGNPGVRSSLERRLGEKGAGERGERGGSGTEAVGDAAYGSGQGPVLDTPKAVLEGLLWVVGAILGHPTTEDRAAQMQEDLTELVVACDVIPRLRDLFAIFDCPQVEGAPIPGPVLLGLHLLEAMTANQGRAEPPQVRLRGSREGRNGTGSRASEAQTESKSSEQKAATNGPEAGEARVGSVKGRDESGESNAQQPESDSQWVRQDESSTAERTKGGKELKSDARIGSYHKGDGLKNAVIEKEGSVSRNIEMKALPDSSLSLVENKAKGPTATENADVAVAEMAAASATKAEPVSACQSTDGNKVSSSSRGNLQAASSTVPAVNLTQTEKAEDEARRDGGKGRGSRMGARVLDEVAASDCPSKATGAVLVAISETGLVGLPSLLTAVLLQANPPRGTPEQAAAALPTNFEEVATSVLRVLNNIARLDLPLLQTSLAQPDLRVEFFHLIAFLLSHCTVKWRTPGDKTAALLNETLLLIGYFTLLHPGNQAVLRWGKPPTILQKLCDLPFAYFSDPRLTPILNGALIASCFGSQQNRMIVEREISMDTVVAFLQRSLREEGGAADPPPASSPAGPHGGGLTASPPAAQHASPPSKRASKTNGKPGSGTGGGGSSGPTGQVAGSRQAKSRAGVGGGESGPSAGASGEGSGGSGEEGPVTSAPLFSGVAPLLGQARPNSASKEAPLGSQGGFTDGRGSREGATAGMRPAAKGAPSLNRGMVVPNAFKLRNRFPSTLWAEAVMFFASELHPCT